MPHRLTRERMLEAMRELPEDASVDDAIERLVFLAKIERDRRRNRNRVPGVARFLSAWFVG